MSTPHYITTSRGQIRIWYTGHGPCLVAIAGLTTGASVLVDELASVCPGWQVVVVEPPGIGGSAHAESDSLEDAGSAIAEALEFVQDRPFTLLASEMSAALVPATLAALRRKPATTVLIGADRAEAWTAVGTAPPDLGSRDDGTHLNALWSFLRDRRILKPDDATLPTASGQPLPSDQDLSESFVSAVAYPEKFAANWRMYADGLKVISDVPGTKRISVARELRSVLGEPDASSGDRLPPPTADPGGTKIWHQYVDTRSGRAHLRRAGSQGRPILVIPSGGGSSAQFAPVVSGLAETRTVIAVDYFGNGLSEKTNRDATIDTLAKEAIDVLDALGLDEVDVWGSHTGACVGLELAINYPKRVRKLVMEAPVIVTPEFRRDLLANYFPDFTPDKFGLHLQHLWNWRRDMFMYWPWYRVDWSTTRKLGVPRAEALQLYVVGILESGPTYSRAYRAGFSYDTRSRLPHLNRPAILSAGPNDMLANALDDAAQLAPEGMLQIRPTPTTMWWPDPDPGAAAETLALYRDFLG